MFLSVNEALEDLLENNLPEIKTARLKSDTDNENQTLEVYDDLKGLRVLEYYLGPSVNMNEKLIEEFFMVGFARQYREAF